MGKSEILASIPNVCGNVGVNLLGSVLKIDVLPYAIQFYICV